VCVRACVRACARARRVRVRVSSEGMYTPGRAAKEGNVRGGGYGYGYGYLSFGDSLSVSSL
jgi:hypothetical protein